MGGKRARGRKVAKKIRLISTVKYTHIDVCVFEGTDGGAPIQQQHLHTIHHIMHKEAQVLGWKRQVGGGGGCKGEVTLGDHQKTLHKWNLHGSTITWINSMIQGYKGVTWA